MKMIVQISGANKTHLMLCQGMTPFTSLAALRISATDWNSSHPPTVQYGRYYRALVELALGDCDFSRVLQLHQVMTVPPELGDPRLKLSKLKYATMRPHILNAG